MKNILIHGLGQDNKSWDKVIEFLEIKYPNIICPNLFDLPKNSNCDYKTLYNNFEKQMNQYNEKLNICGLSLGGVLALDYAKKYPEKINSLILIGVPYNIPKTLFNIQTFIFRFMPKSNFTKLGLEKSKFISLLKSMKDLDISSNLEKIDCKTLLIYGGKDRINIKNSNLFEKDIKYSKIKIIKNSGHAVNTDSPKDLSRFILDFWDEKFLGG